MCCYVLDCISIVVLFCAGHFLSVSTFSDIMNRDGKRFLSDGMYQKMNGGALSPRDWQI